jgi:hypothetical protein
VVLQGSGVCFVSSSDLQGLHRQPSPAFCHPHQASSSVQSTYHSSINIPQFNQHTAVQTTTSNHHFKPPLQTTTSTHMATSRGLAIADLVNPSTPTKRSKCRDLSRDDRIKVRGLHQYGHFTYPEIARRTNFSQRQVQRACTGPATPQKTKLRKGRIPTPQKEHMKAWLQESKLHQYVPLCKLRSRVPEPLQQWGETALFRAVSDLDYYSRPRLYTIDLTPQQRRNRVVWCQDQLRLRPRPEDWEGVLFSDEKWALNDPLYTGRVLLHEDENI